MTTRATTVKELSEATSVDDVDVAPFTPHQLFEVHELLAVASTAVAKRPAPHFASDQDRDRRRAIRCHAAAHGHRVLPEVAAVHVLTPDERPSGEED